MKKTIVILLLTILAIFLSTLRTTAGGAPFQAIPILPENQISDRAFFDIEIAQNHTQDLWLALKNDTTEDVDVIITAITATTGRNGRVLYSQAGSADRSMRHHFDELIYPNPSIVTIPALTEIETSVRLRSPRFRYDGIILGALHVTAKRDEVPTGGITNEFAYSLAVRLTTDSKQRITPDIVFENADLLAGASSTGFALNVRNIKAELFLNTQLTIEVSGEEGNVFVDSRSIDFAPNSFYPILLSSNEILKPGLYTATVSLDIEKERFEFVEQFSVQGGDANLDEIINDFAGGIIPTLNSTPIKISWWWYWLGFGLFTIILSCLTIFLIIKKKEKERKRRVSMKKARMKAYAKTRITTLILVLLLLTPISELRGNANDDGTEDNDMRTQSNVKVVVTANEEDGIMPEFLIVDHKTLQQAINNPELTVLPLRNNIELEEELGALTIPEGRQSFSIVPATSGTMIIRQANENIRHFYIENNANIIFNRIILDGAEVGGGISVSGGLSANITANISGVTINNCTATYGGAMYVNFGTLHLTNSIISNNSANSGGGIFLGTGASVSLDDVELNNCRAVDAGGAIGFALGYNSLVFLGEGVSFNNNFATQAYWIEKDSAFTYLGRTAINWKLLYVSTYEPFVKSLTALPEDIFQFGYMFNNYDVAYIGSEHAKTAPIANRVIFSPLTNIPVKHYEGEASFEYQLLNLANENKPVIEIYNSTKDTWSLNVKYTPFLVDDNTDNHLKFAFRNDYGDTECNHGFNYKLFHPDYTQLVFQAEDNSFLNHVPWGEGFEDMLKVLLPAYRHDLQDKSVTTVLTWSLSVTP
ncbi:MAG: DUF916 and DUF3324 domain-containing protein [Oscillospiraceae bacterium]|jgi:hypothetical protein|nr:DUF916 and DUF3324 domain-containing protein [Oscillospiraceae bacterium]